jgi:hypothetical protein
VGPYVREPPAGCKRFNGSVLHICAKVGKLEGEAIQCITVRRMMCSAGVTAISRIRFRSCAVIDMWGKLIIVDIDTAFLVVPADDPDDWLAYFQKRPGFPALDWAERMVLLYNSDLGRSRTLHTPPLVNPSTPTSSQAPNGCQGTIPWCPRG